MLAAPSLRRWTTASAIACPLLLLTAFFFMIGGLGWWTVAPLFLWGVLSCKYPYIPVGFNPIVRDLDNLRHDGGFRVWGFLYLYLWLDSQPEFEALRDRFFDGSMLHPSPHWNLLLYYLPILTVIIIYGDCRMLKKISDKDLVAYRYGKGEIRLTGLFQKVFLPPKRPTPPNDSPAPRASNSPPAPDPRASA
jgi:hypothetical protein